MVVSRAAQRDVCGKHMYSIIYLECEQELLATTQVERQHVAAD